MHIASNASKLMLFRKGFDRALLINMGIPSVIAVILGGIISAHLNSTVLNVLLGFFLVAFSLILLLNKAIKIKPGRAESIIGGSASGLIAGLLGTGGAIRGLTMAAFNLEKDIFIATSAAIDFFVDISRAFVYYSNGYIHRHDFIYIPFLLAAALAGTFLGKRILRYIPQTAFRNLTLFLILITGVLMLIRLAS